MQCSESNQHIKYLKTLIFLPRLSGPGAGTWGSLRQLQIDALAPVQKKQAEPASKNVKQTVITEDCTFPPLQENGEGGPKINEPRLLLRSSRIIAS